MARATLPVRMGGLNLPAMAVEAPGAYVAAFAAAVQELHGRMLRLYNNQFALAVAADIAAVPPDKAWAAGLRTARDSIGPLLALLPEDQATLRTSAPEGPPALRPGVQLGGQDPQATSRSSSPRATSTSRRSQSRTSLAWHSAGPPTSRWSSAGPAARVTTWMF